MGSATDSCGCCLNKTFLILTGLIGLTFFGILLAMSVAVLTNPDSAVDKNSVIVATVAFSLLFAAHFALILGVAVNSRAMIVFFVLADTVLTLAVLVVVGIVVGKTVRLYMDEDYRVGICDEVFVGDDKKAEMCKDKDMYKSFAISVGVVGALPTIGIYLILMISSCCFIRAINKDKNKRQAE